MDGSGQWASDDLGSRFGRQLHRLAERQAHRETRAAGKGILRGDRATVGFAQLSGTGKAESQATGWLNRAAIKSIEDFCFLAGSKSRTAVCHDKEKSSVIAPDARVDYLVRRAAIRRVGGKSRERLLDQAGID